MSILVCLHTATFDPHSFTCWEANIWSDSGGGRGEAARDVEEEMIYAIRGGEVEESGTKTVRFKQLRSIYTRAHGARTFNSPLARGCLNVRAVGMKVSFTAQ